MYLDNSVSATRGEGVGRLVEEYRSDGAVVGAKVGDYSGFAEIDNGHFTPLCPDGEEAV